MDFHGLAGGGGFVHQVLQLGRTPSVAAIFRQQRDVDDAMFVRRELEVETADETPHTIG